MIKGNFLEVRAVVQNSINETILPKSSNIVTENIEQAYQQSIMSEQNLYVPTKRYKKMTHKNDIREAMVKGYTEMSQINLTICSECLHLEYEAEHMVERLVCGG